MRVEPSSPANDEIGYGQSDFELNGEREVMREYLRDGMTVFDVGANNGSWSEAASKTASITIHAFEPVRSVAVKYFTRLGLDENINLNICALGRLNDKMRIFVAGPQSPGQLDASHVSSFWMENLLPHSVTRTPMVIECRTLDRYCRDKAIHNIDFMKIDVEGAEMDVLAGGYEMVRKTAIIQFEYNYTWRPAGRSLHEIFHVFRSYGFRISRITSGLLICVDTWRPELEMYRFCNYLATRI